MRRKWHLFMILVMTQLITGCGSRIEVNDIAIVVGIAIDKIEDDKILLTLQIAIPATLGPVSSSSGGEKESTIMISAKGETVMDAYRSIQEKLPRKVFFAHNRILLIGERLAKGGVSSVLDFFSKIRESRLRSYVLFTKGDAADILKLTPRFEKIVAEEIREQEKQGVSIEVKLSDFYMMLMEEGLEPVGAQVEKRPIGYSGKGKLVPTLVGAAVFHNDQLIGWLDDSETRGALWLRGELKTGVITVIVQEEKGGGQVSAKIMTALTNSKPKLTDEEINIEVEIKTKVAIEENTSTLDLGDPKVIEFLTKEFEEDVKNRVQLSLEVQKELKSDIFGFGQDIHRKYPNEWNNHLKKQWDEKFPNLKIKIIPQVTVINTGFNNQSFTQPEEVFKK